MSFWKVVNGQVRGIKDPDAVLDYPISFAAWLADIADSYASHTISVTGGLVKDSDSESSGVITPILSAGTPGQLASFTIHLVTSGRRKDDRTFYLDISDR